MSIAAPTSLAAASAGKNSVLVTWTDSVGPNLLFTRVYVSAVNSFAETNFYLAVPAGTTAATVSGLSTSTAYYFWAKAEDNSGTPTLSLAAGSVTATPVAAYSVTPTKDFLALDVLKQLVASITGFGNGTGTFPLFTGPATASSSDAGFVSLVQDVPFNPHNRTNGATLSVLCLSQTESKAFGAAEAIREYLHPNTNRMGFSLPSGRFVLAARNAVKTENLALDANSRFQVKVTFELQLQDDVN